MTTPSKHTSNVKEAQKRLISILKDNRGVGSVCFGEQFSVPDDIFHFFQDELEAATQQGRVEGEKLPMLKSVLRVVNYLRKQARDQFMRADVYAQGYYQAIKDIEQYFGVSDDHANNERGVK